jgi:hypothetical protein
VEYRGNLDRLPPEVHHNPFVIAGTVDSAVLVLINSEVRLNEPELRLDLELVVTVVGNR